MYLLLLGAGPQYPVDVVHDGGLQQLVQPLPVVPRHGQAVTLTTTTTTRGDHCSRPLFHHLSLPNQTAYSAHSPCFLQNSELNQDENLGMLYQKNPTPILAVIFFFLSGIFADSTRE